LFDPIFFMYGEENDLCWRIRRCGSDILFVPKSKVYHEGMASIGNRPCSNFI
jgi:GT2 family glycosyltransferase